MHYHYDSKIVRACQQLISDCSSIQQARSQFISEWSLGSINPNDSCSRPMINHIKSKMNKERRELEKAEGETPTRGRGRARAVKTEPRGRRN